VETEGEITQWDKFAAHGSVSRYWRRTYERRTGHDRSLRKKSRDQVAVPPRRQRDSVVMGHIGNGTTAGSDAGKRTAGRRERLHATARCRLTRPTDRRGAGVGVVSPTLGNALRSVTGDPHAADAPSTTAVTEFTAFR
jgi:hypothetical protein